LVSILQERHQAGLWDFQKNGWMDDRIGERWFKEIFLKQCGTDRPQVLILDNKGNNKITELRAITVTVTAGTCEP
jgi:hypothetical protein